MTVRRMSCSVAPEMPADLQASLKTARTCRYVTAALPPVVKVHGQIRGRAVKMDDTRGWKVVRPPSRFRRRKGHPAGLKINVFPSDGESFANPEPGDCQEPDGSYWRRVPPLDLSECFG